MAKNGSGDLEAFLGGSSFSTINPAILDAAKGIADTFFEAGGPAWSTMISRGVLYTPGSCEYQTASDALHDSREMMVVTTVAWEGDRSGTLYLLIPATVAKGAIAYFLALAMGTEADPEHTPLDAESLDAYSELVNTMLGQGAQALRGKIGGKINLVAKKTEVIDFSSTDPQKIFGSGEYLCHNGQITIEGLMPDTVRLFLPVSVTGMTIEIEKRPSVEMPAPPQTPSPSPSSQTPPEPPNRKLVLNLDLPVIVILAEKKVRMEAIRGFSPGSIIEFRKLSGEFLDIYANNIKIGEGEVVVTNQHFGIQIRKLVHPRHAAATSRS